MSKFVKLCLVLVLLTGCFESDKKKDEKDYNLSIITQDGEIKYKVENAVTPEELQTGLMGRESLDEDKGMIFNLASESVRGVSMWMKNTKIPLDMLFTDSQGKIVWIYENAIPYSEELITPPLPVSAVIEINGDQVRKHKIQNGDIVKHEFFKEKAPIEIVSEIVDETPLGANDEIELGDAEIEEITYEEAANAVADIKDVNNAVEIIENKSSNK